MNHGGLHRWKDRSLSFLLGIIFAAIWMLYPFFKSFSGEAATYVASVWFFLIWCAFFIGGSAYLFYDAFHGLRWHPHHPRHHPIHHTIHRHHIPHHFQNHGHH